MKRYQLTNPLFFVSAFLSVIAFFVFMPYLELPVVRNALYYGNLTLQLVESHFDIHEIFLWEKYYKGMGFSLLATPFMLFGNVNVALKLASLVSSIAFMVVGFFFFRRLNKSCEIDDKMLPIELLLLGFNPLVMHQLGSGFADIGFSVFMMTLLWGTLNLIETDRLKTSLVMLYGSLIFGYLFKTAGLLYFPLPFAAIVLLSLYRRKWVLSKQKTVGLIVGFVIFIVILVLMINKKLGVFHVNLNAFKFFKETTDYNQLFFFIKKFVVLAETLILTFSALLVAFFFHLKEQLKFLKTNGGLIVLIFGVLFFGALLMEYGTSWNIRYFLPLFPLFVLLVTNALRYMTQKKLLATLSAAYLLINSITVFAYNHPSVHMMIPKSLPIVFRDHDNFRLDQILERQSQIYSINQFAPQDSSLVFLDAYYSLEDDALGFAVYENMAPFREDLKVQMAVFFRDLKEIPDYPFVVWHKYSIKNDPELFTYLEGHDYEYLASDVYLIKGVKSSDE